MSLETLNGIEYLGAHLKVQYKFDLVQSTRL